MPLYTAEALVLRTYKLGEADRIVVFLTRDRGKKRGVAPNARKSRKRFGAALEPFTLVRITYYQKENQELASINTAEILTSHFGLSSHAETLTGLAYMGDLVLEFSPPHHVNEKLYRMVKACLEAISQSPQDMPMILRYFEVWLLKLEGYLPDLRRCADCGSVFDEARVAFLASDLSFRCRDCTNGAGSAVSRRLQLQLRATQKLPPFVFAQESREVPASIHKEMAELTHQLIVRVLERQPRLRPNFR